MALEFQTPLAEKQGPGGGCLWCNLRAELDVAKSWCQRTPTTIMISAFRGVRAVSRTRSCTGQAARVARQPNAQRLQVTFVI